MELFWTFLAALVFAAACNLDTVILAMGYGMRGVRLDGLQALVIGGITTVVTWLSLVLGDTAAAVVPEGLAALLGGLVLVGIGMWFLLDWLRRPEGESAPERRAGTLRECVSLAAALAVNNAGIGVAAGVSGVSPGWAAAGNFLVTLAALYAGRRLGDRLAGKMLGKYALPLSGVLLIALGAWEVLVT